MRLNPEQVENISRMILTRLKEKEMIIFKAEEDKVLRRVESAIMADLKAEEALDREVDTLLASHSSTLETDGIDYRRMFNMIKGKLVRERDLII